MKKFIGISIALLLLVFGVYELYFGTSWFTSIRKNRPVEVWSKTQSKQVFIKDNMGEWEPFTMMGVDLGAGMPGKFATEFAIPYEMYMEWFQMICDMNANVIRIYTILSPTFYEAFHDFNAGREDPLFLIHGVWVDDAVMRSGQDAYDPQFREVFMEDCRKVVDIIHGRRTVHKNDRYAYGRYRKDISDWVLGYILGVEWEQDIVLYTDDIRADSTAYEGKYLYTTEEASGFEMVLAQVGDALFRYESEKYGHQRLLAFSNWPETDPLEHEVWRLEQSTNLSHIDVEHIYASRDVQSGMFASYHIYPYYPLFMDFEPQYANYIDENGINNPYYRYLQDVNDHHSIPVIITEFGLPASRGVARINNARGMNQGGLSEAEQAERLPVLLDDIMNAGCNGAILFAWHDEWFKRTWNTWPGVDLLRNAYWSDYQTNEQFFGVITFDPGDPQSICYVDGDASEWEDVEVTAQTDGLSLQVQYDEKFIYFHIESEDLSPLEHRYFIPINLTDRSGALADKETGLTFEEPVDFLLVINGTDDSRVLVHAYYDTLYATERRQIWEEDGYVNPPPKDVPEFHLVEQFLRGRIFFADGTSTEPWLYPTGKLVYGNANPSGSDFNSLADFMFTGNGVEIRIPYGLLNFADPSSMRIHDDYYEHHGVAFMGIDSLSAQLVAENARTGERRATPFGEVPVKGWYDDPTFHMRIKASYYSMREAFFKYTTTKGE